MAFSQEIIERIRAEVSIADIVGDTVTLKRSGKNLSGLCPFHSEKTPSFFVNDEEGYFNCFGCGKKGSVFDFVMETKGLSFPEAIRFLARRVGIALPEQVSGRGEIEKRKRMVVLRELMRVVLQFYREQLAGPAGSEARGYLTKRCIPAEMTETFQLGFAPDGDLLLDRIEERLGEKGKQLFPTRDLLRQALQDCGLVTAKNLDYSYDTFRGRLIFPITRSDGSPIALGGRLLRAHDTRPKYINSRETILYQKARSFFGLSQAMKHIRLVRELYLVEGYMDVLAMHQLGFVNSLATCGTAVTPEHVKVLKRIVDRVVVVFDGDDAGVRAAAKCFEVFLNSGIDVQGTTLPTGEDPGSLAEKSQGDVLKYALADRRPAIDLFIENRKRERGFTGVGAPTISGKIADQTMRLIRQVENPVEREFFQQRAAEQLGVSMESLEKLGSREVGGKRDFSGKDVGWSRTGETEQNFLTDGADLPPAEDEMWRERTGELPLSAGEVEQPRFSNDFVASYQRQLVVAIVAEPMLARSVLDMPSLSDFDTDAVVLNENLRGFLQQVAASDLVGISSLITSGVSIESEDFIRNRESFQRCLAMFGFPAEDVVDEAIKQTTVGGGQPKKVADAAPMLAARGSLSQDVEKLRTEEAAANDGQRLAELAQEKLMKRRHLEKLRGSRN